jgi:rhodanese-related sulfurtransferase
MVARWALALGYKNVFRYVGGWKDWTDKKFPIEKEN